MTYPEIGPSLSYQRICFSLILIVFLVLFNSCHPAKKLSEGEKLLVSNVIRTDRAALDKEEIDSYIKQKPNRRIFAFHPVSDGYPFYLGIYNMVDVKKMKEHKTRRDQKYNEINTKRRIKTDRKNSKREAKGKRKKNPKLKSTDKLTWREWLVNIGEEPVIYDSALAERSARQISLYLNNKGYFNNTVHDSVSIKGKRAEVFYIIETEDPYTIRNIAYQIDDSGVGRFVLPDSVNRVFNRGDNYDVDRFQMERDRITKLLKNQGFYYFSKEYVYFTVDSALNKRKMDVVIGVKKNLVQISDDSVVERNHKLYLINDIYINTEYVQKTKQQPRLDTTKIDRDNSGDIDWFIMSQGKLKYKPNTIMNAFFFKKSYEYRDIDFESTYRRLSELRAFRYINIDFRPSADSPDYLDMFVNLTPVDKQNYTTQGEGTNTGSVLGVAGSIVYQNKNTFRGAEVLEIRLKGGLEIQKQINEEEDKDEGLTERINPFNTFEIGPEVNLSIPKALPPFTLFNFSKKQYNPRTVFGVSYNNQSRPDYKRTVANFSHSLQFKGVKENSPLRFAIFLPEVGIVKAALQPSFAEYINASNDIILRNRFTDHMITALRFSVTFNNQDLMKKKNVLFVRLNLEQSGSLLYTYARNNKSWDVDSRGSYEIFKIPFSHYFRPDIDFRYYRRLRGIHNQLVYRVAGGYGKALKNTPELPFEKSFYAGGPNSVRAWEARTLGPGSYTNTFANKYQLGDIHIESNLEYRFKIFKLLNSALFVDAGNIWIDNYDPNRIGGQFQFDTFLDELAIGAGLGFRLDFSFFIIRLDGAVPLKDPAFPSGDRWQFDDKPLRRTNLNFGIGYPF